METILKKVKKIVGKHVDYATLDMLFRKLFFEECYYLNQEANAAAFSELCNIRVERLETHCIQMYGLEFKELCNQQRVKRFLEKIDNPVSVNLTVGSIIKGSGFKDVEELERSLRKYSH